MNRLCREATKLAGMRVPGHHRWAVNKTATGVEPIAVILPHYNLVAGYCRQPGLLRTCSGSHVANSGIAINTNTINTMIANIGRAALAMVFIWWCVIP
jgi:hypothetical protein